MSDLTDEIDDSLATPIQAEEVSSDILESIDISEHKQDEQIEEYLKKQFDKPFEKDELFVEEVDDISKIKSPQALGVSEEEGYVYFVAFKYYIELVRRARIFNRDYCKATKRKVTTTRRLKDPKAGQKYTKEFNPFVYRTTIESYDSVVDLMKRELVSDAPTADEAALRVAYQLGFLDTVAFKSAKEDFHPLTIAKIEKDPKYMKAVRMRCGFNEEIKQVSQATYAPKYRRDNWGEQLIQKIQAEIEKQKGAV